MAIIKMFINEMKKGKTIFLQSIYEQRDGFRVYNSIDWSYDGNNFICQYDDEIDDTESYTEDEMQSIFDYEWAEQIEIYD